MGLWLFFVPLVSREESDPKCAFCGSGGSDQRGSHRLRPGAPVPDTGPSPLASVGAGGGGRRGMSVANFQMPLCAQSDAFRARLEGVVTSSPASA